MNVEQLPPNKPNFLLILILFCLAVLIIFGIAWIFLRTNAGHLGLRHHNSAPTRHSQMLLPHSPTTPHLS